MLFLLYVAFYLWITVPKWISDIRLSPITENFEQLCQNIDDPKVFDKRIGTLEKSLTKLQKEVTDKNITACFSCGGSDLKAELTSNKTDQLVKWRYYNRKNNDPGYPSHRCEIDYQNKTVHAFK